MRAREKINQAGNKETDRLSIPLSSSRYRGLCPDSECPPPAVAPGTNIRIHSPGVLSVLGGSPQTSGPHHLQTGGRLTGQTRCFRPMRAQYHWRKWG